MKSAIVVALLGALALSACAKNNAFSGDGGLGDALSGPGTGLGTGFGTDAVTQTTLDAFNAAVGDTVLFAVDKHTLTPQAAAQLDGQAGWLMTNMAFNAVIEGHADEQGTREYNLALSARRASAVYNYLISKGITADRMTVVPYGKERPLATCSVESCWAKNRRAVTRLSGGFSS